MTDRLLGAPVAERLHAHARGRAEEIGGRPPSLASVHLGGRTPFAVYLDRQAKAAERDGFTFRSIPLSPGIGASDLAREVGRLDAEPGVDAVLIEHPLPEPLDFFGALSRLRVEKDVDGVGAESLGRLVVQRPVHVPAVARAAIEIARHYHLPLEGRRVAVIGRSPTVGLPIALLALAKGAGADATVTVAHRGTRELARSIEGAELLFSCAGAPGLLDRLVVPKGAAVVDVGLSTVDDPSAPGGHRIAGDANAEELDGWASALSPVPGGVGPVTVAALMRSVAEARALGAGGPRR